MKFEIKNRRSGSVQYSCELSAEMAGKSYGLRLGFAVKKALAEGSDLRGSDLSGSDLSGSDLTPIRDDVWAVLSSAPAEAAAVRDALAAGKVNGSTYEGSCACLVGTIAQARHVFYNSVDGLRPASWRPAERFFMAINEGDTPETSQACAIAHGWVSEWIERMESAFAPKAAPNA